MELFNKTEVLADMANHYRCFEMLAAQAKADGNVFDEQMYMGKLQDTASQYGQVAELDTYGEVHRAVFLPN